MEERGALFTQNSEVTFSAFIYRAVLPGFLTRM